MSNRKPPNRTATRKPDRSSRLAQQKPKVAYVRGYPERLAALLANSSPEAVVPLTLPHLWAVLVDGEQPVGSCVDAAYVLGYAYGYLGIRSRILATDLVVKDARGELIFHGHPEPRWTDDGQGVPVYSGHLVLALPDSRRFVDATVEQFPEVARLRQGPFIGLAVASTRPDVADSYVPGASNGVMRGKIFMLYTWAAREYTQQMASHPRMFAAQPQYAQVGLRVASHAVHYYRTDAVRGLIQQSPYSRVRALVETIGDSEMIQSESGDIWFDLPGGRKMINEIDLPEPASPIYEPEV